MQRLVLWVWVTLALVGTGCSSNPGGEGSGHTAGDVTITWATLGDETGFEHQSAREFEASHPGVHVRLVGMPASSDAIHDQFATYLVAEEDSIDLYSLDVVWTAEFGAAGWALPLEGRLAPGQLQDYLPGPKEACTSGGHLWALPWYSDAGLLYYRKDLLAQAHAAPPQTWDELIRLARQLQTPERAGFVFQAAQYEGLVCNAMEHFWGNGGAVLDAQGHVVLDQESNVEAMETLVAMVRDRTVTPPGILGYREDEGMQAFRAGRAVFLRSWPYVWGMLDKPGEKLQGRFGVVPVPHSSKTRESAVTLGGWNLMVSRYSRHPDETLAFACYITRPEAQKARCLNTNRLPNRRSVYQDKDFVQAYPPALSLRQVLERARPRPTTPFYSKLSDILQLHLHQALAGTVDARTALRTAAAELRALPGLEGVRP